ncbi:MAG: hypothetical protein BRC26_03785 [Nanohaloarchaea archaeon QH_8_44_6]|nr:MAG: hypothetical protein BRC26_03785 [Nanohaloarchaea archaeon QH_8_44_6]
MANIILNIILIPKIGIIGAAVATAGSTVITNSLLVAEAWRREKVLTLSDKMPSVIIASMIPLVCIITLDRILFADTPYWFLIPAVILYYSVYALLFVRLVGLDESELKVIRRLGEKTGQDEKTEKFTELLKKIS